MVKAIDKTDLAVIGALQKDGRATNTRLAAAVGVSEATIASRIRRLTVDGVLYSVLQRDIYAEGYAFQVLVHIWVSGRSVRDVAAELAASDQVSMVSLMQGSPEISLAFNARDHEHARDVIAAVIAPVQGIARLETATTLEIGKFQTSAGILKKSPKGLMPRERAPPLGT